MIKVICLIIVAIFYGLYVAKALLLKKQGITVNLLQKNLFEKILRVTTGVGAALQLAIPFFFSTSGQGLSILGLILAFLGLILFFIAIKTMGLNWRAGFGEEQETNLVKTGIYRISRNPAFVGFDLLYVGFALVFFNAVTVLMAIFALILFNQQIRREESYLTEKFGEDYRQYKLSTKRYFWLF